MQFLISVLYYFNANVKNNSCSNKQYNLILIKFKIHAIFIKMSEKNKNILRKNRISEKNMNRRRNIKNNVTCILDLYYSNDKM